MGPWAQPLSVPGKPGVLAGLLCWGGVGGAGTVAKERHAPLPTTAWTIAGASGAAQGRSRGPPLAPLPGLTWMMGPGRVAEAGEDLSPQRCGGQLGMDLGPLIKTLMTPTSERC